MLYCDIAASDPDSLDNLAVCTHQIRAAGIDAAIHVAGLPSGLSERLRYVLTNLCTSRPPQSGDSYALFNADDLGGEKLAQLHAMRFPAGIKAHVFGRFDKAQSEIQTKARLSYVFGADPVVHAAANGQTATPPLFVAASHHPQPVATPEKTRLLLLVSDLEDPATQRNIQSLAVRKSIDLTLLTRGQAKSEWIKRFGLAVPVFHFSEAMPLHLAKRADVLAILSPPKSNFRLSALIAQVAAEGKPVLDCTLGLEASNDDNSMIPAPSDLGALPAFLADEIWPQITSISALTKSTATRFLAPEALFPDDKPMTSGQPSGQPRADAAKVMFMPTNGVGLGHAQRCALIADAIDGERAKPIFAAFPSCINRLRQAGFDSMPLIPRAEVKSAAYEYDLHNMARISELAKQSSVFVFDGGYVFSSVYNTILDHDLKSVWIRRGMWQAGQNNTASLDREKAFDAVIVPTEAFDELNESYSRGSHVHDVGPIVDAIDLSAEQKTALRQKLAHRFDTAFDKIVVTMLGGGVAADRRAQTQAICAKLSQCPDVLHLVVVWPTAVVDPAWYGWHNTRVVRTQRASALTACCDLFISAVGYNSFHEVLYNKVPTIFMAQMNTYMDDQEARARAAEERGLAHLVPADQLATLERKIDLMLHQGGAETLRNGLAGLTLPPTGNRRAAEIIEGLANV